jgi:MFS family permease
MASSSGQLSKKSLNPWMILFIVVLTGMAGPVNYYKVPPLLPSVMDTMHITGGIAGFLMSIFAVVGIILSIPAGLILNRIGYRWTGLMATGWIALGAGIGAIVTNPVLFLITRVMEGIGLNLLAISSPTIVALHFEGKARALAVGVWNAWYPLGATITFIAAPILASRWGWRSVWWFGCFYAILVGVLYFLIIKTPPDTDSASHQSSSRSINNVPSARLTFHNKEVWIMSSLFFCFAFMYIGYLTWTPTFLHKIKGVPMSSAAFTMSILSVIGIFSPPVSGWLLARLRSPRSMAMAMIGIFAALASFTYFMEAKFAPILLFTLGVVSGFIPSTSQTVVARLIHEKKVSPIAFSMVTVGQNIGILIGPTLLGIAIESSYGWPLAYALFIPVGLFGISTAAFIASPSRGRNSYSIPQK